MKIKIIAPLCLTLACLVGNSAASEQSDRAEIRDASGRYRGTLNGTLVRGDTVNPYDDFEVSTRMPRKKGKFTNRLKLIEFEGSLKLEGNIRKIKVRGKKVRYRGVLKLGGIFGEDSPPLIGLLNATSKRTPSGRKLKYPISLSRLFEADDIEFLDEDVQVALLFNFSGSM